MTNMLKGAAEEIPASKEDESFAPSPTPRTKALRTFLPWQILRFFAINIKMFQMITKSHE
jgi:hypothetical protein